MPSLAPLPTHLPQELIDDIIDYVPLHCSTDYPMHLVYVDLAHCSLVSRAWLPRSSRYLLEHIGIGTVRNLQRKQSWRSPEDALFFLRESERLRMNIRKLSLRGAVDLPSFLDEIFWMLPYLRSLELNRPPVEKYFPSLSSSVPAYSLDNLVLSGITIRALPLVLKLFKHICALDLSLWHSHEPLHLSVPLNLPTIDSVTLKYSKSTGVTDIVNGLSLLCRPRSVTCIGLPGEVLPSFCELMRSSSQNMEDLTLAPMMSNYSAFVGIWEAGASSRWEPSYADTFSVERDMSAMHFSSWASCSRLRQVTLRLVDVPLYESICRGAFVYLPHAVRRITIEIRERQLDVVLDVIATEMQRNMEAYAGLEKLEFSRLHLPIPGIVTSFSSLEDLMYRVHRMLPKICANITEISS